MLTAVEEQRSPRGLTAKVRVLDAIEACCVTKALYVYLGRINVEREGVAMGVGGQGGTNCGGFPRQALAEHEITVLT